MNIKQTGAKTMPEVSRPPLRAFWLQAPWSGIIKAYEEVEQSYAHG